jgi:hypothetical protein
VKLKPVCLLLCLCHAGSTAAFGLGEISVRSFLGQPLDATVTLLDTTPAVTADCFSLGASTGSIAPPPRAQLSIELAGEQRLLHIRTTQPIHDPVAQFALVSDCEARLQRDYVVLLDPPAQVETVSGRDEPAVEQTAAAPIAAPAPRASRHPHHVKRAPAVTARPSAVTPRQPATPHPLTPPGVPRLVLSGKHHVSPAADIPLALRLDTNLPDLTQPRPEKLSATELSDENTALGRKLAHLEAQLVALQQRNAALEARRVATPTTVAPPPKQPVRWPLYLLAIGLLASGGGLAAWLRRRGGNPHPATRPDADPWTHPDALPTLDDMTHMPEFTPPPAPQRMPEIAQPLRDEGTEVKEDILDQAEVFMAHGHGDLAAHLLQEHLREAPTESPVPWLMLLDLLHRAGDTVGYATASAECRRYFNINLSGHPIFHDNETGDGLEAYPHLLEQLVHEWNSPDIEAFFNDLIYDHRGGTRLGFEPGAYRDILLLRAIAQQALPLAA